MTVYTMSVARDLKTISLSKSHRVEIELKCNNKQAFDFFNDKIMELLSDEHYLDYLKEDGDVE